MNSFALQFVSFRPPVFNPRSITHLLVPHQYRNKCQYVLNPHRKEEIVVLPETITDYLRIQRSWVAESLNPILS
jgi:hypothetical protein